MPPDDDPSRLPDVSCMRPDHHRAHAWAMDEGTPFARFYWCWGLGQRYKRYGGEIRHVVDVDILGALVTEEGAD